MWKAIFYLFAFGLICAFIGLLFEALATMMAYIIPTAIIVACIGGGIWLFRIIRKHRKERKKQIPTNLDMLIKETGSSSASSKQQLQDFLGQNTLVRSFHTRVVGVSCNNDDGSSRQEILKHCLLGEPVGFYWYTFNGRPACAVISDHGQIGHLSADLAEDLNFDYSDDRYSLVAHISGITGGHEGYSYGCNLLVSVYESVSLT